MSIICCLPQGTLAVLALQLARQIHFQTSLPAGPWRVEHCSWYSPLDRFLSSPLRHPCSCEFLVPGIGGLGWEFLWARKHLWTLLRKRAIRGSLPFLSAVRGRGMGGSSIHPGCGPHLPPGSLPCPPLTFRGGSHAGVQILGMAPCPILSQLGYSLVSQSLKGESLWWWLSH